MCLHPQDSVKYDENARVVYCTLCGTILPECARAQCNHPPPLRVSEDGHTTFCNLCGQIVFVSGNVCRHHPVFEVYDEHTGDVICTHCGLVKEARVERGEDVVGGKEQSQDQTAPAPLDCSWQETIVLNDLISEAYHKLGLEISCLNECTLNLYLTLLQENGAPPGEILFDKHRPKLALAMLETMSRSNIAYSPQNIANLWNLPVSALQEAQKVSNIPSTYCNASYFITKVEAEFELDFKVGKLLRECVAYAEKEHAGKNPETIVVVCCLFVKKQVELLGGKELMHRVMKNVSIEKLKELFQLRDRAIVNARQKMNLQLFIKKRKFVPVDSIPSLEERTDPLTCREFIINKVQNSIEMLNEM